VSALDILVHRIRPAAGQPEGLIVLHHGRGTDENDLLGLADVFDPERRLQVVTPRAPLRLQGSPGYHWYVVRRVGYPDPETFHASYERLTAFHDALWDETGIAPERTVLGGFSMGSVMSYATGLGPGRPRPAGILAFSGFVPTVERWAPELESRAGLPVLIVHGRRDPVISVEFGRRARELLEHGGLSVEYLESDAGHNIDPAHLGYARDWLAGVLSGAGKREI
jgi:phospholipase/carboxylesterase